MNGKLDANWIGVPAEGYGFSNDATGVLGSPSFPLRASSTTDRTSI
ncbi:MAG: DUF2141 domain-containing protein [Ramlibacter sp.]